jgi:hypothetical protein
VAGVIASRLPFFKEGMAVLSERFTSSAEISETTVVGGLVERVVQDFTAPFRMMGRLPMSGYGLGLGTAGGARFIVGQGALLLSENEWTRILAESGPILGFAFIIWRVALTAKLFWASVRAAVRDEVLPILLFGSGFLGLLNGQLGQPTTLGFTAVLCGLCLAATRDREIVALPDVETTEQADVKRLPRRSVFADRIHNPTIETDHTNGSVDR